MAPSKKKTTAKKPVTRRSKTKEVLPEKMAASVGQGQYRVLGSWSFNGEKNLGEMGPVKDYALDYDTLRDRSWQLFLESEVAQTVLGKYNTWVIGKGLRLQSEPVQEILKDSKINLDRQKFTRLVEARFAVWSKSRRSDYSNMRNLNMIQSEALKNTKVGGDVLVILRYKKGNISVQMIDGVHVVSPMYGDESMPQELEGGNTIVNGIELSPSGEHVAYYVRKPGNEYDYRTQRILARGSRSGMLMAYMVYGNRYRLDTHRGMPMLSVVFETAKKLERYKEATLGSAEERQKIAYAIEHDLFSTGENPLLSQTAKAYNFAFNRADLPTDSVGDSLANRVAATTNKQTYNLPLGAHLTALESKNELYFKDFYEVNIMLFCAAVKIPFEVALSFYNNSFSASRAALKDWENTLIVEREDFSFQFMQPIFELFLYTQIHAGDITAPGFLDAERDDDFMVLGAYYNSRFSGAPVPHIDPMKEVSAERLKLGVLGAALPLTNLEASTEALNGGDSEQNMEQFSVEKVTSEKLGLKMPEDVKTKEQKDKKKNKRPGSV